MKRLNTSPISGMQELLPREQVIFDKIKQTISEVYHAHGFQSIETPIIDRCEILLAKAGGDTEKQIYKVIKTNESADDADQALRFDHTVPLARYVVEHENDLSFPFKVTQIGRNFRGERAQKGRFRELYQCDVDIIGRGDLPLYYDADVISTLLDVFSKIGIRTPVLARINNRKILSGLLEFLGLSEMSEDIFSIIDHSEKVPTEKTRSSLEEIELSTTEINKIMAFINLHGPQDFVIRNLRKLNIDNATFNTGVDELETVTSYLGTAGYADSIEADMRIVRGLDYYTGTVFEFILPEHREIGSVCGGGRYENLASFFTDQSLPGVGGSIGLSRLFYVLREHQLIDTTSKRPIDFAIIPLSDNELDYSLKTARTLRESGVSVTIISGDKKLGDKLKYAASVAMKGIVIGENEVNTGSYEVKEFN